MKQKDTKIQKKQTITVTPRALSHIKKCVAKRGAGLGMRVHITQSGCVGYRYEVSYVDTKEQMDKVVQLDENVALFIDKKVYPYLIGMNVDYQKDGLNSKFLFKNPNHSGSCGCGESFSIDQA